MSEAQQSLQDLVNGRQHDRLLRLTFPNGDGPGSQLLGWPSGTGKSRAPAR